MSRKEIGKEGRNNEIHRMKGEFTEGMNFLRKFETLLPNDSCYKITLLLKNHFNSKVDLIIYLTVNIIGSFIPYFLSI